MQASDSPIYGFLILAVMQLSSIIEEKIAGECEPKRRVAGASSAVASQRPVQRAFALELGFSQEQISCWSRRGYGTAGVGFVPVRVTSAVS